MLKISSLSSSLHHTDNTDVPVSLFVSLSLCLSHRPYHQPIPAGLQNNIQFHHRTDVNKFFMVSQLACPCVGVHIITSLMILSLLLRQCPACLLHLTRNLFLFFAMRGKRPCIWCFVGLLKLTVTFCVVPISLFYSFW